MFILDNIYIYIFILISFRLDRLRADRYNESRAIGTLKGLGKISRYFCLKMSISISISISRFKSDER